jgi:hypothetical protein
MSMTLVPVGPVMMSPSAFLKKWLVNCLFIGNCFSAPLSYEPDDVSKSQPATADKHKSLAV